MIKRLQGFIRDGVMAEAAFLQIFCENKINRLMPAFHPRQNSNDRRESEKYNQSQREQTAPMLPPLISQDEQSGQRDVTKKRDPFRELRQRQSQRRQPPPFVFGDGIIFK